jgi:hypothetical protein
MNEYFEAKLEELQDKICQVAISQIRKRIESTSNMNELIVIKTFLDAFDGKKCESCKRKKDPLFSQLYNNENLFEEIANCSSN